MTPEEDYRIALLSDSPQGCSLSDPRGRPGTSAKRPGHLGRFLPPVSQANSDPWLRLPRTRTSALSPLGDWARGKETLPAHQPSAGHSIQPPTKQPQSLPIRNQQRNIPDIHPSRSRKCRAAETEVVEKAAQFGGGLCLRAMPTVGTIVGIGVRISSRHRPPPKIRRRETAERAPRPARAGGRSAWRSWRSDDALNCAARGEQVRGQAGWARSVRHSATVAPNR